MCACACACACACVFVYVRERERERQFVQYADVIHGQRVNFDASIKFSKCLSN